MSDMPKPQPLRKTAIAVLKGSHEFQAWFKRLQELTRLPAAVLLDASLAEFAKSKWFEEPPPR